MAIFHFSANIISRGKGRSAVAAAAYRSGSRITNEYDGVVHDYRRKRGVIDKQIFLPDHVPREYYDRATLWNAVEKIEKAKNAQLAREIEIAIPKEISLAGTYQMVKEYITENFVSKGMIADCCYHDSLIVSYRGAYRKKWRKNMDRLVRTSAKALVIKDGCMLAIKLHDSDGDFYIMPGGGQAAGELLSATVQREVAEETGISVKAKDALFIIEGAEGEKHHRVDVIYLCDYIGESNMKYHPDKNQVGYEWLEIATLNKAPLYPSKLRRAIMNYYEGKETPVYLGNENVGDPEITY